MPRKSASYDDFLSQQLREDPQLVLHYLKEAQQTGEPRDFFLALKTVINALEGMTTMEEKTGIKRASLYKMLSDKGNPGYIGLSVVLDELGFTLEIKEKMPRKRVSQKKPQKTHHPQRSKQKHHSPNIATP